MSKRFVRGLTLVELLVAVGLGILLIGVITFVWLQSNKIFTSTLHRLEAYGRLRTILDLMERDLANTTPTVDMEFYEDADDNGHFQPGGGDALLAPGPAGAGPQTGPPSFREPASPYDPLVTAGLPEFNEEGNASNAGFSDHPFFYGPLIFSPPPYRIDRDSYTDTRRYWRDEIYVRTFAMADEINRPALVHYRLVQNSDDRSSLRRRMWFRNMDGEIVQASAGNEATDRTSILANGICDLKFGFFFKRSAGSDVGGNLEAPNGYWYHVGAQDVSPAYDSDQIALVRSDERAGYYSALNGSPAPSADRGYFILSQQHANRDQFPGEQYNAVAFFYQGHLRAELSGGRVLMRTIEEHETNSSNSSVQTKALNPIAGGSESTYTNFGFDGVRPGDKIFLFDAQDDDFDGGSHPTPWGGPEATDPTGTTDQSYFPNKLYTVDFIASDESLQWVSLAIKEPVNFRRLARFWLGREDTYHVNAGGDYGPDRDVDASFNCGYRVAFLPAAFRIHLSIDDTYNKKVLPMERVVHLLQR